LSPRIVQDSRCLRSRTTTPRSRTRFGSTGQSACVRKWRSTAPRILGVTPEQGRRYAAGYLAGYPADAPAVSPLTADLAGLPPLLIQAAAGDPMREDARRLASYATSQHVEVQLQTYPSDTHVFHTFWTFLPEAADALRRAGQYIRRP
jgi:monoterpene epsilon-lactone hydrolase